MIYNSIWFSWIYFIKVKCLANLGTHAPQDLVYCCEVWTWPIKKIVYVKFLLVFTLTWFSWKLNHLRSACWYLSFYKIWNYILQTFANARPRTNRQRNKWNGLHNPSFSGEKNEPIYSQYLSKRGPQYLGILCIRGCYVLWHSPRYHESHMSSH